MSQGWMKLSLYQCSLFLNFYFLANVLKFFILGRETSMCERKSNRLPPALTLTRGSNPQPFGTQEDAQLTEPHWPGPT